MKLVPNFAKFAGAAVVAALAAGPALGTPLFTVDESVVPNALDATVTADKLNGSYNELLTINADGSFATSAYGAFTSYVVGGSDIDSQLGAYSALGDGTDFRYRLYFAFESTGSFLPPNGFTGATGSFQLWLDPLRDTAGSFAGATGADGVTSANVGDDILLASAANVLYGTGVVADPGAYEIVWDDFTLNTGAGSVPYFISPDPFYMQVLVDGDFDAFSPSLGTYVPGTQQTFTVRGDVSAVFLPEPGTLALTGLALGALGFVTSRRRTA